MNLAPLSLAAVIASTAAAVCACNGRKAIEETDAEAPEAAAPVVPAASPAASAIPPSDPMSLHHETREELLSLFQLDTAGGNGRKRDPEEFLRKNFGPGSSGLSNQGNKEIAHHSTAREACLAGLEGITLQTDEQKRLCKGREYMVPIYPHGRPEEATACIDVFEFPNRPCELPFVWISPVQASIVCELQGKRLCTQQEWSTACAGDPGGGADQKYAYGEKLDLEVCNTNKSAPAVNGQKCDPDSSKTAWKTCSTNTEPAGAFPKCRSRFGVFDQHGNVAEIMTRQDPKDGLVSQLKGSAFFYVDVARSHDEKPSPKATHETYPDHCAYDPRWHVEPMTRAWHVNYHLGFRCCMTVP